MPNISTTDDLATVAKIAQAAHLVAVNFPTLPADEQTTLAVGLVSGKLAYCDSCGHIFEAGANCTVCDDLADAAASALADDEYNRNATRYGRF